MYYTSKYDEKYALIIGINDCGTLGTLENAENDAIELKDILIEKYNYKEENVKLLLGSDATKNNINDCLYGYGLDTMANDSILIYYAGHGTTILDGKQNHTGFLVPYGGSELNYNTLILWSEIVNATKISKAKHVFFIFDACYSGLAFNRCANLGESRFASEVMRRYSRQALTAGKGDQTVSDAKGPMANHSLFTGYLLKYLTETNVEENIISATSVMSYVYNNVSKNSNTQQIPQYGFLDGDGDFIFNSEIIPKLQGDGEKSEKIIERNFPDDIGLYNNINNSVENIKMLISDKKNKVKINELVNQEIRIAINKIKNIDNIDTYSDEIFLENVNKYEDAVSSLIPICIYLSNYGEGEYNNLINKIITRMVPKKETIGHSTMLKLRNYPVVLIFYSILITAIENGDYSLIDNIFSLEKEELKNNLLDTPNVFVNVLYDIFPISKAFNLLYKNENNSYKYPLNEHIYSFLLQYIDDILFLGEDYEVKYITSEIICSLFYAINMYDGENDVYGLPGKFIFKYHYQMSELFNSKGYEIANKSGLFKTIKAENIEDFKQKYCKHLRQVYF